ARVEPDGPLPMTPMVFLFELLFIVRFPCHVREKAWFPTDFHSSEKVPGEMEKDGCRKTKRINAVHHAAMAFNHVAVVFNAAVALDSRHDQPAAETHESDGKGHSCRLQRRERRCPPQARANQRG